MLYYSTNNNAKQVSFPEALLKGLAEDGGLYLPETIPVFDSDELEELTELDYPDIAYKVVAKFLADDIDSNDLKRLIVDAYNYPVPLEKVEPKGVASECLDSAWIMRLDQGPTASFKDFAARLMGRLMQYYLAKEHKHLLILTATSGDTGSAIANAFYGLDQIKVVVLYPELEVTARQRKQMTTLGKNIRIIALDGKFDDCQALVKKAFNDRDLDYLELSSANSINIGRLIPQIVYYFYAYARLVPQGQKIIFSVPSGNFGDLMGGLIAKKMGLPVHKFVVATNANDEFPKYLETGIYNVISPSRNCISSAMNVGHPSNVARLIRLYGGVMDEHGKISKEPDMPAICRDMYGVSISDTKTSETIVEAWTKYKLLLEPHGAVGWAGLNDYLSKHPEDKAKCCVSLETAHPAKFPEKIQELLGFDPTLPDSLSYLEGLEEFIYPMQHDYQAFKAWLQENYQ